MALSLLTFPNVFHFGLLHVAPRISETASRWSCHWNFLNTALILIPSPTLPTGLGCKYWQYQNLKRDQGQNVISASTASDVGIKLHGCGTANVAVKMWQCQCGSDSGVV